MTTYKVNQVETGPGNVPVYSVDIVHTQGDALEIDYDVANSDASNITAPTSATLNIATAKGVTPTVTAAMVVTDSTTSYCVATTVEGTTMDITAQDYYYEVVEVYAAGTPLTKLSGRLTITEDV